jgi:hypothetical protein
MGSRSQKTNAVFSIIQQVDQKPIRADMAFSTAHIISRKGMVVVFDLKRFIVYELEHDRLNLRKIQAALSALLQFLLEPFRKNWGSHELQAELTK